jgi:hypothetical protein
LLRWRLRRLPITVAVAGIPAAGTRAAALRVLAAGTRAGAVPISLPGRISVADRISPADIRAAAHTPTSLLRTPPRAAITFICRMPAATPAALAHLRGTQGAPLPCVDGTHR